MNSEKNRQENKKALKVLIPLTIGCGIAGGIIGAFSATDSAANLAQTIGTNLNALMRAVSPYCVILVALAGVITELVMYQSAKRQFECHKAFDDEDEEEKFLEKVDNKLSFALLSGSICMILSFMFFAAVLAYLRYYIENDANIYIAALLFFIVASLGTAKMQQVIVDLEKIIAPEKQGSVYDIKFAEKWEESCDEMEKYAIYKSAYASYKATNKAYAVAVVLLMLLSFFFQFGPLPAMTVCALWIVSVVSYCLESIRLEKEKLN